VTRERPKVVDLEARGLEYRVRVVIDHPTDDLAELTQLTGLLPDICATRGQERCAANGTRLPGRHSVSIWQYSETFRHSRAFSLGVRKVADALTPAAATLQRICASGGRAQLILDFKGHRNIGDVIGVADLGRLAQLGVSLGIEVFP
jgi:hypothetical protein